MDIAIVGGTGALGIGLALRFARVGHRVVIGSRSKERADASADGVRERIGGSAKVEGLLNAEAVDASELTFVTVPFAGQAEVYASLKGHVGAGDIIVDTTSPLASALGGPAWQVVQPWAGSAAEQAASFLPDDVRLVAGFHTLAAELLQDLDHDIEDDVLLSGDDGEAKSIVGALVEEIPNLRWADVGDISTARITESLTALLISINRAYRIRNSGLRLTGRESWGVPER
ncbi:MAG: NADPH-dependent F420 reductase [Actinomycetota bacterium]|nr:NADPH-dependent F420 reductase [Actinomycetota bacterium]